MHSENHQLVSIVSNADPREPIVREASCRASACRFSQRLRSHRKQRLPFCRRLLARCLELWRTLWIDGASPVVFTLAPQVTEGDAGAAVGCDHTCVIIQSGCRTREIVWLRLFGGDQRHCNRFLSVRVDNSKTFVRLTGSVTLTGGRRAGILISWRCCRRRV